MPKNKLHPHLSLPFVKSGCVTYFLAFTHITEVWQVTHITEVWQVRVCLGAHSRPPESIMGFLINICYLFLGSILAFRIDSEKSKNFLLSVRIIFRGTIKHKLLYLKINSIQINSNKINYI